MRSHCPVENSLDALGVPCLACLIPTPIFSWFAQLKIAFKVRCHSFLLLPFLSTFVKTGFDVNALKNTSRSSMSCQVKVKERNCQKLT